MKSTLIKFFYLFLLLFVVADLAYSYKQYDRSIIDGDLTNIVFGFDNYDKVLSDPIGWKALNGDSYPGTNRYTAHKIMSVYFKTVPFFLQNFVSPIDSVYLSISLVKIAAHILFLLLFGYYSSVWFNFPKWKSYLFAAAITTTLFVGGNIYMEHMAIIDPVITYTFFYAVAILALLIFYIPFFNYYITGKISKSPVFILFWMVFAFFLVFFGPLPSAILLISIPLFLFFLLIKNFREQKISGHNVFNALKSLDKTIVILYFWTFILSLYSFYISTKNSENGEPVALKERFSILLKGIEVVFFNREQGVMYIIIAVIFNVCLIYFLLRKEYNQYLTLVLGIGCFIVIYILLLPLGGYRSYRPLILRRDTILPVLIMLYYILLTSSIILIINIPKPFKIYPVALVAILMFHYNITDREMPTFFSKDVEKQFMERAAVAKEDCIPLERWAPVASWGFNAKCEDGEKAAILMYFYHITPRKIYLYYPEEPKTE